MSNRTTLRLSDFAKILVIVAVLATGAATHLYDNWRAFRMEEVTANEMTATLKWLDQFYASADGLQRSGGLVENGRIDFDAISQWLFRIYLHERSLDASPESARISIEKAIRATPEWQRKHR